MIPQKTLIRRMKFTAIVTIILFLLLSIGSMIPLEDNEAEKVTEQLNQLRGEHIELKIFLNNLVVSLLSYIPFAGPCILGYTIFHTGRYLGWISNQMGIPSLLVLSFTIVTVYGIFEFLGYGVATTESITLSYYLIRSRKLLKREIKILILSIAISMTLLLIGALIESSLIRAMEKITSLNPKL